MPYCIRRVLLAFLAVVPLLLGPGNDSVHAASRSVPGPEESIRMLQKGIDDKDIDLVQKYLDIDSLVGKAVDQLLANEDVLQEAGKNPAIAMVLALGGNPGANEALRSLLAGEAREYVSHGVTTGAFAGAPDKNAAGYQSIFGKVFRGGEKDKKHFGPASVKSRDKTTAVVSTTLVDGVKKKSYPLDLKLEKQQDVWRVVGLANPPAFTRKNKDAK